MADQDNNVMHLMGILDTAINEVSDKKKKTRNASNETENTNNLNKNDVKHILKITLTEVVELMRGSHKELKEEITAVKDKNIFLQKALIETQCELEKSQQYINRDTIKICNVPEPRLAPNEREDVKETVMKVFEKAEIEIENNEFSTIHRLPSREDNCKAIIMKFNTRDVRN